MLQQFLLYEFPLHQFPLYQFPLLQHFPLHQIPFLMFWADNFLLYHFLSFIVTSDSFTSVSVIPISFFGYIRFRCNNFRFIVISVSVKSVSIISESVISISFFCYNRFRYINFLFLLQQIPLYQFPEKMLHHIPLYQIPFYQLPIPLCTIGLKVSCLLQSHERRWRRHTNLYPFPSLPSLPILFSFPSPFLPSPSF